MSKETIVRVMTLISIEGVRYQPNQLVKNISNLEELLQKGFVSASAEDIKYCTTELGVSAIDHKANVAPSAKEEPEQEPVQELVAEAKASTRKTAKQGA